MNQPNIIRGKLNDNYLIVHKWFSNPLDWSSIDRLIAIASLNILMSFIFGLVIFASIVNQQNSSANFINVSVANLLLIWCGFQFFCILTFVGVAFIKRHRNTDWPLFAYAIGFSYVLLILFFGWATGTYFSNGVVLLFFGFALCVPLIDLGILSKIFIFGWSSTVCLIILDLTALVETAPLFSKFPVDQVTKKPLLVWFLIQIVIAFCAAVVLFVVTMPTVRRWRDREDLYREMSCTDWLTQLTSRRSFIERCILEFAKLQRQTGHLACIMIDLDYFKKINDTHGHQAGDSVLIAISDILLANAREYDEVGRYGGEEFAILLPDTTLKNAALIAERIRMSIETTPFNIGSKTLSLTASFGIAAYPSKEVETINDILKKADDALYEAKQLGRNVIVAKN